MGVGRARRAARRGRGGTLRLLALVGLAAGRLAHLSETDDEGSSGDDEGSSGDDEGASRIA
ncbi:hypothetical protein FRIGORI9N_100075 [Frigoribacterium sp. 9N]|nr:hypothetical protein FRIGORI9N_100075 [Frigoribacterium sp. 9N]